MAGFFPHIGNTSVGGYTSLPTVHVTGILDSIVTDVGAGVNNWTVHDDQRTTGVTYPWAAYLWNNGRYTNSNSALNTVWTFQNGSPYTWGDGSVGFNYAASISSGETHMTGILPTGSWPPISVDNVTWYRAAYTIWAYPKVTATLDRNYAGSTTSTRDLWVRFEKYVVLKCNSTTKTFYQLIAQMPGCSILYTQTFEDWNNTTHVGTQGGQIEIARGCYWDNRGPSLGDMEVQYIMCLYPEAMFFWIHDIYPGQTVTEPVNVMATAFYAGNLDTTGISTTDKDALWFGCSDTSYSGFRVTGGVDHLTQWVQWGASQCLRTQGGSVWQNYNSYHLWGQRDNMYSFVPRGRSYVKCLGSPTLTRDNNFSILDVDIYQCGFNDDQGSIYGNGMEMASEGRRGMLRYLKVPAFNPSGMHLATFGPSQDGRTYIMIMCGYPFPGNANAVDGSAGSLIAQDINCSLYAPSSFAESCGPFGAAGKYANPNCDIIATAGAGHYLYRYLMMPMI